MSEPKGSSEAVNRQDAALRLAAIFAADPAMHRTMAPFPRLEAQVEKLTDIGIDLIQENAALTAQLAEKDAALQAAIQRAEEAEENNRLGEVALLNANGQIMDQNKEYRALQARMGKLEEALEKGLEWFHDPDENALSQFERIGDWFYRETGHLRPGKDDRMEDTSSPENRDRFLKWCHGKSRERLALFRAALASREGGEG